MKILDADLDIRARRKMVANSGLKRTGNEIKLLSFALFMLRHEIIHTPH